MSLIDNPTLELIPLTDEAQADQQMHKLIYLKHNPSNRISKFDICYLWMKSISGRMWWQF
jgi:hypothetical protein